MFVRNCGFIRPHARRLIEDWVRQKKGGADGDNQ